ncbi:MAG: carbon monoxide dehydrogenase subunit G [Mariniblastus sp.]|jgi:carbon monoxide dehydrogenase subunit G
MPSFSKILLWLLIAVCIAIPALWLAGGKKHDFEATIDIDSTPDVVFSFVVDPDKNKTWMSGLRQIELYSDNQSEEGRDIGKTTSRTIEIDAQELKFSDDVLRFEQDSALSVRSTNSQMVMTSIFRLTPKGDQTSLSYRITTQNSGIGRFMAVLNKTDTQARLDKDILALKNAIESTSGN